MQDGFIIRPDDSHITELVKLTGVGSKKDKKTPTTSEFNKLSKEDEELGGDDVKLFRSCVGKLLYLSPDRPDIQYVTQGLAGFMKTPTKRAWSFVRHLVSYLQGSKYDGVLMKETHSGKSVLNVTDGEGWDSDGSLLEVICDADYAGNQRTRRSLSSVHFYVNGNLVESYVRGQKCISLSSGESEYVCMVGGVSEGMFLKHLWDFISEGQCQLVCRSDSSAARSLASRQGIGRARHIAANLLWLQEKVAQRTVRITAIPTAVNVSDMGTKSLSRARMESLKFLAKMVSWNGDRLGVNEFQELAEKERMRKQVVSTVKQFGGNARLATLLAITLVMGGNGEADMCLIGDEPEVVSKFGDVLLMCMWLSLIGMVCLGALSLARVIVVVYGKVKEYRGHNTLVSQVSELEAELEKLKHELTVARGQVTGWITRAVSSEGELEEARVSLAELEREVSQLRQMSQGQSIEHLSDVQQAMIAERVCSLEFGFSRFGSAYHDRGCHYVRPPQSRTAEFARACSVCVHKAVRGVL